MINSFVFNPYNSAKTQRYDISSGVGDNFSKSIFEAADRISGYSDITKDAIDSLDNVIILKDTESDISDDFENTREKFHKYASDAYGFVSKNDNAVVIVEDNHKRKDVSLEGSLEEQGADTFAHEIGHIVDKDLSQSEEFKQAYFSDLKEIESMLEDKNSTIY